MTATKTNEREGTRAVLRHSHASAYKVRAVLDLIRGKDVQRAREALQFSERDAAQVVDKLLRSAVANAENNDGLDPEGLYVSACYADEGPTMKRWRPRARGRATRIRKRTCHVTVIVSRLPDEQLARIEARQAGDASRRARRVAGGRQGRRAARQEQVHEQSGPVAAEVVPGRGEQEKDPSNTDERGEPAPPQEDSEGGGEE
jgi:large subunit ribosomal protein L22